MKSLGFILLGIIIGIIAVLIFDAQKIKRLNNENAYLKQKISGQQIVIEEKTTAYVELKKQTEADIAMLNGAIDSANTIIARREEEIRSQDKRLGELQKARESLTDKDEIIKNQDKQLLVKDEIIASKDKIIGEKDAIIFSLTEKYDNEHELRLMAEGLMEKMAKQISDQALFIKNLEHELGVKKKKEILKQIAYSGATFLLGMVIG